MKRVRILVADDDDAVRATLAALCESIGHQVVAEAANGSEALALAESALPDIALLDIKMPEPDGIEVARQFTSKWNLPALLVTAHADESLIRQAAASGAFNYILKPITREKLSAAISVAIARFSDMQDLKVEVGDLRQDLEDRKTIERAKGILMRDMQVGEQEAFQWLKRTSSHHNTRLAEVARRVVALETGKGNRRRRAS
jgi:AmiR/NasT family two-component response regulator